MSISVYIQFVILFIPLCFSISYDYYLSTTGKDTNDGSINSPWLTIKRAQSQIPYLRSINGGKLPGAVNFHLSSGYYFVSDSIVFTPEHSGDSDAWITFTGSEAIISGGFNVTNWTNLGNNQWVAQLPKTTKYFRQLWMNGKRILSATTDIKYYEKLENPTADSNWFQYAPNDILPTYHNLQDVEVVMYHSWTASIHKIKAINPQNNTIILDNPTYGYWNSASGKRYYLQNIKEESNPGTFYYDSVQNKVYYNGNPGDNPNHSDIIIPQVMELIKLVGENTDNTVKYIEFNSLQFSHSMVDVSDCFKGTCDSQSASFLSTAAIHGNYVSYVKFLSVQVSHLGGYGIWLHMGCNNNIIQYAHVFDLGAGGIRIGLPNSGVSPSGELSVMNTINDSVIEDGGHYYQMGVGVFIQQAAKNTVAHNEIRYFKYTGVSVGWSWGYAETSNSLNFIGFNLIHHIGEGLLSDMGCVYNLGVSPGTLIYNNICHDVLSYNYGGWGYYTDEGSSWVTIENNIVYNTKCAGFHQHYGENNLIKNNVFSYNPIPGDYSLCHSAVRSSQWAPGSGNGDHSSFTFQQNIIFIGNGSLFLSTQKIGFDNMTFDNNIYWSNIQGSNLQFPPTQSPISFQQWQKEGKDIHSLLVDPLFVDITNFNFKLKEGSPAFSLGIVSIDISEVGPRKLQKHF